LLVGGILFGAEPLLEDATMSDNADAYVSPECFRAYVSAEIKIPNTLIAVGPYVGLAALSSLPASDDLGLAVTRFAKTYSFSRSQMKSASRTVGLLHGKLGVPVLPDGADVQGKGEIRLFPLQRFEVVYMEGVMNILEAILRLHGERGTKGSPREPRLTELLAEPGTLEATVTAFAAAESAIDSAVSTELSEAFKEKFNFTSSGEKPRPMAAAEKDGIQAAVNPFIDAAVKQALAEGNSMISAVQVDDFVRVLTSPELHEEAA
jgi:hypothetical protein